MKPVNAEDNPGLAKLPTEVRNKMGYMKKGGMAKHPMKKGSKRMKKFENGGPATDEYKGTDEIVQYRMGQIKDPGIDLFKLVRGEEQVAKPIPLDKKPQTETVEPKVEYKESIVETESDLNPYGVGKGTTTAKKQTFGEAFKSARAGGGKTFTYNGKSYTTDLAKPSSSSTTTSSAKPAEKLTEKPAAKAEVKAEVKTEPKKSGYGRSGQSSAPSFAEDKTNPLTDEQKAESKSAYTKKMEAGKSQSPLGRFSFGDNKMSQVRAKKSMAAEGNYKKGGSVKMASGGKVSSASKRADGCAMRGKTRA